MPWLIAGGVTLIFGVATVAMTIMLEDANIAVLNPKGAVAQAEYDLIVLTLWLSAIVVIPVFIMLGAFAWRYRESNTKAKYTPNHDSDVRIEAVWWGIPIIIIGILSVITWVTTHQLDPYKPLVSDQKAIRVQVVSMQWKWLFLYPDYEVASVNVLKMPVGVPVDFEITGDAPMSAFWIPNLGTQTYAMNGMSARLSLVADEDGTYRGSNSNLAGEGYADMHFNVETARDMDEFKQWAKMIREDDEHEHIDMTVYEEMAQPSRNAIPRYMHLHDRNIYAKVLNKYMDHGYGSLEGYYHYDH